MAILGLSLFRITMLASFEEVIIKSRLTILIIIFFFFFSFFCDRLLIFYSILKILDFVF